MQAHKHVVRRSSNAEWYHAESCILGFRVSVLFKEGSGWLSKSHMLLLAN